MGPPVESRRPSLRAGAAGGGAEAGLGPSAAVTPRLWTGRSDARGAGRGGGRPRAASVQKTGLFVRI